MYKVFIKKLLCLLDINYRTKLKFVVRLGYLPNLKKPQTFNEKINFRKIHEVDSRMVTCSDKFAVRDYVKEKIGEKYLIPLLYHGNKISKENLESLDCDAVVKATHDSGNVYFIKGKNTFDYQNIVKKVNDSLKSDFGKLNDEPWYSAIGPGVVVEKMLKTKSGDVPADYKFHVFNNTDKTEIVLQVDYDRFTNHSRTFYDAKGSILPVSNKYKNRKIELSKDIDLPLMHELVKKLSEDFSYVRVDIYDVDSQIYFGELTFAHEAGLGKFSNTHTDLEWGAKWNTIP